MNTRDMEALARFQHSTPGMIEHWTWQLELAVDSLTDSAKTRDGAREIPLHREAIKRALVKLYDLYLDSQPNLQAAE